MPRSAPRHAGNVGSWGAYAFLAVGIAAGVVYAVDLSATSNSAAFGAVGLGAMLALLLGPRWQHAEPRRPWTFLGIASALFLIGALARSQAKDVEGAAAFVPDLFTLPGYFFMIAGLIVLLRARGGVERHAIIDGLIVWVGAAVPTLLLLSLPAAGIRGRSASVSLTAGIYPLVDTVLVLLLVNLAFTTAIRKPSYLLLIGTMILLLGGDLWYAIEGVNGKLAPSNQWMDFPFLLGFVLIGTAALHPSVVDLSRATPLPVQAWSWRRLVLVIPAIAVPFVLTAFTKGSTKTGGAVLGIGGAIIVTLLFVRAISAVSSYAVAQRRYQHQATHDQLTGLPNRSMLASHVDQLLLGGTPRGSWVWVYFLDLDGFKLVNDSWGHAAGDQLIAELGRRLRHMVPPEAMVARVGGDEFVIAYVGGRTDAAHLADRVLEIFSEPLRMRGAEVIISTSVGIAASLPEPTASGNAEALMRDADTAMYQAKAEGPGNWVVFDSSMHDRVRERVEIELALRQALVSGQLRLVYQPIVDLVTGRIQGAEALARWDHPTRGAVSPEAFIPVAEDTGLITRIGRWVLDESLSQLARWRKDGTVGDGFWISINVSPRQLRDPTLPATLSKMLIYCEIPPHCVVLEITESVVIDASAVTSKVLFDLRGMGIRIVVDDFGTGYSALGYLRRHPVTGVKVDRAFVRGLGVSAEDEEIVRAVVAMTSALNLSVVAEGVETTTQQEVLASLGVPFGQGKLWGPAVPPHDFRATWSVALAGTGGHDFPGGAYIQ
jgi:diguanylate cyclase (GGDEF)-like protein